MKKIVLTVRRKDTTESEGPKTPCWASLRMAEEKESPLCGDHIDAQELIHNPIIPI